jgi:hypothetical protein
LHRFPRTQEQLIRHSIHKYHESKCPTEFNYGNPFSSIRLSLHHTNNISTSQHHAQVRTGKRRKSQE